MECPAVAGCRWRCARYEVQDNAPTGFVVRCLYVSGVQLDDLAGLYYYEGAPV